MQTCDIDNTMRKNWGPKFPCQPRFTAPNGSQIPLPVAWEKSYPSY
jgi:hypothetical protein